MDAVWAFPETPPHGALSAATYSPYIHTYPQPYSFLEEILSTPFCTYKTAVMQSVLTLGQPTTSLLGRQCGRTLFFFFLQLFSTPFPSVCFNYGRTSLCLSGYSVSGRNVRVFLVLVKASTKIELFRLSGKFYLKKTLSQGKLIFWRLTLQLICLQTLVNAIHYKNSKYNSTGH